MEGVDTSLRKVFCTSQEERDIVFVQIWVLFLAVLIRKEIFFLGGNAELSLLYGYIVKGQQNVSGCSPSRMGQHGARIGDNGEKSKWVFFSEVNTQK